LDRKQDAHVSLVLTTFDEAKSDEEVAQAVLRLGVASTKEPNPELVKRFAKAMKSHYPGVRSAALVAVSYRCSDEVKPLIQELFDHETEEDPKNRARRLVTEWDQRLP